MVATRFVKAMAVLALFNGLLFMVAREDAFASEKEEEAKKYAEDLRKAKDSKTKVTALKGLGELAQIKKSFITPALPEVYKATDDKDPGVRAAAAEALGKADEPYSKVGEILVKLIKEDKEESVKIAAIRGLTVMGNNAKDALPTIREVVNSTKNDKKSKLGAAAKDAVKAIGKK